MTSALDEFASEQAHRALQTNDPETIHRLAVSLGVKASEFYGPVIVSLGDVAPQSINWVWPERIARGKLTLIAGDPGLGKSFLTLDIASRISTGVGWPDRPDEKFDPSGVVLLSAEDDIEDTIVPRLLAAGADTSRIVALKAVRHCGDDGKPYDTPLDLSQDVKYLRQAAERVENCRLIVVDPISAYLGRTDSHNNSEVRACLAQLADLASELDVAILAVSHLNKGSGTNAIYRVTGSLAFTAAARAVWAVTRDDADRSRRLMLPVKSNLSPDTTGLAYSLVSSITSSMPSLRWEADPVTSTADDALSGDTEPSAKDEAAEFLREILAPGPMSSSELRSAAKEAGINWRTLNRAKDRAKAVAEQTRSEDGNRIAGWVWRLKV